MKVATAFHKAFIKYGGALDTMDLPEEARAGHQNILIDYREFSGPGIYFDFIRNKGFNAIATVYGGYEMIGIYHGLTLSLSGLFNVFLSDPEVFPDFESEKEAGLDSLKNSILLSNFPSSLIESFSPKSEARAILARNLTASAIMFILYHERTHIEAGHLHLLNKEFGVNAYEELPITQLSDAEQRLRRALEIEADNGAAFIVLRKKVYTYSRRGGFHDAHAKNFR